MGVAHRGARSAVPYRLPDRAVLRTAYGRGGPRSAPATHHPPPPPPPPPPPDDPPPLLPLFEPGATDDDEMALDSDEPTIELKWLAPMRFQL